MGKETTVDIDINGEKVSKHKRGTCLNCVVSHIGGSPPPPPFRRQFIGHGLTVVQRNYLEVYPYERWSDKEIPDYESIAEFEPSAVDLHSGETQPPPLLTEADLIALMDRHGIGTDATHAEHIETVKQRAYIGAGEGDRLVPGVVGIALCDGYDSMGFEMSKPNLRAELEADLKR